MLLPARRQFIKVFFYFFILRVTTWFECQLIGIFLQTLLKFEFGYGDAELVAWSLPYFFQVNESFPFIVIRCYISKMKAGLKEVSNSMFL